MAWFHSLLLLALGISRCSASIIGDVADLNKLDLTFDFIVVGGGTAGNVVAKRLAENFGYNVLVLEAGGTNANVLGLEVPFMCPTASLPNTPHDWNFTTTPQAGLSGRSMDYPRGLGLGGSSSTAKFIPGARRKILTDQNELFDVQTSDHHNITGQFNPAVHGFNGINTVSLAGFPSPIDDRVIETTTELAEFPFNLDMNSGSPLGLGWGQRTVKNGSRSSSATSYLAPQFVGSPNLHVLLNARVTRVLQTATGAFRTVEFVQNGKTLTFTAKNEVVLSAGSVGTPNILLHSGIGDSSTLTSLGIEPLHNLPSVGQNLTDHPLVFLPFLVNSNNTFETAERNATLSAQQLAQWNTTRTGPLVDNPLSHIGFFRVSGLVDQFPDPAAGPNTAHFEFFVSNGLSGAPPATGNFMTLTCVVVAPAARGSVALSSNNVLAAPNINPNFLGTDVDLFMMREAIKSALRFASAPAWAGYVISPVGVDFDSTDAELNTFILANTGTIFHAAGTASMSPKGATWGVVDPDLLVKGLTGLRIVDTSVVPFIPSAHTQAATYAIAERAADLIKAVWGQ
ncbi:alcohol oxidase [Mycena rosella]|uniref:Alcohol oxidase n=1 Tax=Mycena rosella TaxID=1033263 RepID=A0AAD7GLH2_MYCRO|nr:alcohol oxidase [Mycena rosella]